MTNENGSAINPARKRVLKKATYIFVFLMLALTFFSSTLYNLGLIRVVSADVRTGRLSYSITAHSVVTPMNVQEIYVEHELTVKSLKVKSGDIVKKGQLLAEFDVADLEEEMKAKALELEGKRAGIELAALRYDFDIKAAEEKSAAARKELGNAEALYRAGAETAVNVEKLKKESEAADRGLKKLSAEKAADLAGLQSEAETLDQSIGLLKADIDKYEALRSPMDGYIWEMNAQKGTLADTSKPVFKLANNGGVFRTQFTVGMEEGKNLSAGDPISIIVPSMDNQRMDTEIGAISLVRTDENTVLEITASIDLPGLKGGEMLEIRITKESGFYDFIIPNSAVRLDASGRNYVYVIKEKKSSLGKEYYLQKAFIYAEASDKADTAVTSGLSPFERVVAESDRPVMAGDRVKIQRN